MQFIPYKKCIIQTTRTKSVLVRILKMNVCSKDETRKDLLHPCKYYVGTVSDNGFSITPRSSFAQRSSIHITGRFINTEPFPSIELKFTWNLVDYLINAVILGVFFTMAYFCLRHAISMGLSHIIDIFAPLMLVLAYLIIMLMFSMSIKHRKQEFIDLISDQYLD